LKVAEENLTTQFGLPVAAAGSYARFIVAGRRASSSFREWLGS
jgi:hypothetical protein